MGSFRATVQPSVLQWARESVRLTEIEAAKKIGVKAEVLRSWEEGSSAPTFKQLQTMAEKYRRPVAVLYLQAPPLRFDALKEFRRNLETSGVELPYELVTELDRVRMQQDVMVEIYELEERPFPQFDLSLKVGSDTEQSARSLRVWLNFTFAKQQQWAKDNSLVTRLSELVEERGIMVTQVQRIPITVMRGCALSDHSFPAIVLNGADARAAKVFTLIHEVVHILLRLGGDASVIPVTPEVPQMNTSVERFCNSVAAATLMPKEQILSNDIVRAKTSQRSWNSKDLDQISDAFGVSAEALLLRLITLGRATWDDYADNRADLKSRKLPEKTSEKKPLYYPLKVRDLGRHYISEVVAAYARRDINSSDVADYLDIKVNKIPKLLSQVVGRQS